MRSSNAAVPRRIEPPSSAPPSAAARNPLAASPVTAHSIIGSGHSAVEAAVRDISSILVRITAYPTSETAGLRAAGFQRSAGSVWLTASTRIRHRICAYRFLGGFVARVGEKAGWRRLAGKL